MITIDPPSTTLSKPALTRFFNRARKAVGLEGTVEVLLADDATLKRLNKSFRGKNKATDVLSFPSPDEVWEAGMAGDLAISLETAARQAAQYGHTLEIELKVLMLHGLLHLDGEDHETDDGEMAAREVELREALKLPISLIDRVTKPVKAAATPTQVSKARPGAPSSAKRAKA